MTQSPRRPAELILARDGAWTDVDAEAVASAYLDMARAVRRFLLSVDGTDERRDALYGLEGALTAGGAA